MRSRRNRQPGSPPKFIGALARLFGIPGRSQTDPIFDPPAHAEALVITHILELPLDLAVPDKLAYARMEPRDDVFVDWPDERRARVIGYPEPVEDSSPVFRAIFRRVPIRSRLPLEAADVAFGEFVKPLSTRREWWFRRLSLSIMSRKGLSEWATVVAVTRFIAPHSWPSDADDQTAVLLGELRASIDELNRYIVSLGLVRNNASLFPIAIGDLPALCPCIIETIPMPDGRRTGTSLAYPIHEITPNLSNAPPDGASAHDAALLARLDFHGVQPFFLFLELMQRAGSSFIRQRHSQEIVDLGTAMEVLFSTIVREASASLGEPQARRDGVLMAPLRSQVQDHLGRYANIPIDLADEQSPAGRWWDAGYSLRNRVVHEGHRPTAAENAEAREAANELIAALRDGLRSYEMTRDLGEALAWGEVPPEGL